MKKKLKGFYLVLASLFFYLIHLPFALAKTTGKFFETPAASNQSKSAKTSLFDFRPVYDSLHLSLSGLSRQAYEFAQSGLQKLIMQGKVFNDSIISIVDFSLPSNKKRLFVIDLKNYRVLFNTLVAHGRNSGLEMANNFSNQPSSYMSSPGFYVTGDTYNGHNGYSLKLEGLEKGINDNAEQRAIVVHGADYVSPSWIAERGFIGRSEGCPAVPRQEATPIINTIKEGSCFFIYNPGQNYLSHSHILNS